MRRYSRTRARCNFGGTYHVQLVPYVFLYDCLGAAAPQGEWGVTKITEWGKGNCSGAVSTMCSEIRLHWCIEACTAVRLVTR